MEHSNESEFVESVIAAEPTEQVRVALPRYVIVMNEVVPVFPGQPAHRQETVSGNLMVTVHGELVLADDYGLVCGWAANLWREFNRLPLE